MRSLNIKLTLAFVLVVLLAVGTVAIAANRTLVSEFGAYLQSDPRAQAQQTAEELAAYYEGTGSWRNAESYVRSLPVNSWGDWILAGEDGDVVAASRAALRRADLGSIGYEAAASIVVEGRPVGTIYVSSMPMSVWPGDDWGMGNGMGRMHGQMMRGGVQMMGVAEQGFIDSFNRSLMVAGISSGLFALVLGTVFMTQITSPIRRLTAAARRIATGDLSQRVSISSKDEIGELSASFNHMAETLARNEQARRTMIADIAHELRTPLTVLQGNLEAMLDGVVEPNGENIRSLHEESLLLTRLVTDLRELSLAESGHLKLHKTPTDLASLVSKVIAGQRPEAEEKGIRVQLHSEDDLPAPEVDADRVSQIIRNLLSNAIRYTPDTGRIDVTLRRLSWNGGSAGVEIAVTDTGCGIDAEDLPYVFDRFYRTDRSRSRARGGSGIGLAIVKQLVELHGGRATVESELGAGSTFRVTFPLVEG